MNLKNMRLINALILFTLGIVLAISALLSKNYIIFFLGICFSGLGVYRYINIKKDKRVR